MPAAFIPDSTRRTPFPCRLCSRNQIRKCFRGSQRAETPSGMREKNGPADGTRSIWLRGRVWVSSVSLMTDHQGCLFSPWTPQYSADAQDTCAEGIPDEGPTTSEAAPGAAHALVGKACVASLVLGHLTSLTSGSTCETVSWGLGLGLGAWRRLCFCEWSGWKQASSP